VARVAVLRLQVWPFCVLLGVAVAVHILPVVPLILPRSSWIQAWLLGHGFPSACHGHCKLLHISSSAFARRSPPSDKLKGR